MLPAFATPQQLEPRLPGGLDDRDLERALAALDDASSLIRDVAGKTWVNDDAELALPTGADGWRADTVTRVCLSAARRSLENPEGVTQESLGAYSVSVANASGDVYLTTGEVRSIRRAAGKGGIGAVPLSRGPIETRACPETQYLPVEPPGEPIPFTGADRF